MAEGSFERKPPYSLEAERAVLGACLMDRDALNLVTEMLSAEDFYDLSNRTAYELILDMSQKDIAVDPLTLLEEMSRSGKGDRLGGQPFVASLVDQVSSTANAEFYARIVKDKGVHRRLIAAGASITRLGYSEDMDIEEILEEAERAVFEIAMHRNRTNFRSIADVLGLPSGFSEFDRMTGGFQPGSLNIIAARPSMGKTAFVLNLAHNMTIKDKKTVAIFSLEMSKEQLVNRLLAMESRVDSQTLRTGNLSDSDWDQVVESSGIIANTKLLLDDTPGITVAELRSKCRKFKLEHGLDCIMIDYLQLMSGSGARKGDSRQQEISDISRSLKALARELNVPVIALSQLSRACESRTDHRPMLSDLRESGAIEQDADIVMFLYRDEYYNKDSPSKGITEVIIAKQRNGPIGTVELVWMGDLCRFGNKEYTSQ